MHVVPSCPEAVSLYNRGGLVRVYPSKAHALRELGYHWIAENVGAHFRETSYDGWYPDTGRYDGAVRYRDYVLRNDFGEPLTACDFSAPAPRAWRAIALHTWNGTGPVPGTAKQSGRYAYFRRVRTLQARALAQHFPTEGEPAPRPARNASNIPTDRDDFCRTDTRSWKAHRKHQWKE